MTNSDMIPVPALAGSPPAPIAARAGPAGPLKPIRTRFIAPKGEFAPIVAINTTPLVDVMLVLLIMFIIIIPAATHKVPLDLPVAGPPARNPPPVHQLGVAAGGALSWDGAALPATALRGRLAALVADPARPELHLNADSEARYEQVDQILAQIRGAGITRLGFVNNEQYRRAF